MLETLVAMVGSQKKSVAESATLYNQITRAQDGTFTSTGAAWGGWAVGEPLALDANGQFSYGFSPIVNVGDYLTIVGFVFNLSPLSAYPLDAACLNLRTRTQVSTTSNAVLATIAAGPNDNRLYIRFPVANNPNIFQIGTSQDNGAINWTAQLTRSGFTRSSVIRPYWIVNAGKSIKITD